MSNHIPRQSVQRSTVASGVRTRSMFAEHFGHFIDRSVWLRFIVTSGARAGRVMRGTAH
jgi:hypothetical protein